jgi:hypothetical protein
MVTPGCPADRFQPMVQNTPDWKCFQAQSTQISTVIVSPGANVGMTSTVSGVTFS